MGSGHPLRTFNLLPRLGMSRLSYLALDTDVDRTLVRTRPICRCSFFFLTRFRVDFLT